MSEIPKSPKPQVFGFQVYVELDRNRDKAVGSGDDVALSEFCLSCRYIWPHFELDVEAQSGADTCEGGAIDPWQKDTSWQVSRTTLRAQDATHLISRLAPVAKSCPAHYPHIRTTTLLLTSLFHPTLCILLSTLATCNIAIQQSTSNQYVFTVEA